MTKTAQPQRSTWQNRLRTVGILLTLGIYTLFLQMVQTWPPVVGLALGVAVVWLYAAWRWRQGWRQQQRLWQAFVSGHAPAAAYTVHALALAQQAEVGLTLAEQFLDVWSARLGGQREEDEGWGQGTRGSYYYHFTADSASLFPVAGNGQPAPPLTLPPLLPPHQAVIHGTLALTRIYQGLVPKLMFPHTGELEIMATVPLLQANAALWVQIAGILEILFGLLFLWSRLSRPLHIVNILALLALGAGTLFIQPLTLIAPFNPVTLTLAMAALSLVSLLTPTWSKQTETAP
ncbi:MAG: hypothetical protein Fur0021_08810 [Candidatus Promineifilaceae bacterium]